MARSTRSSKRKKGFTVDFTNAGQGFFTPPEDRYTLEVTAFENKDDESIQADLKIVGGKHDGKEFRYWWSLVPEALWRLRQALEAMGIDIPDEAVDLDPDDIVGRQFSAAVRHRDWNGETKVNLVEFDEAEEEDDKKDKKSKKGKKDEEEEEDEKPARGKDKKSKKGKKEPIGADEVKAMDEEELEELVEKMGLKVDLDDFKTLRKKVAAVLEALEEAELLEE